MTVGLSKRKSCPRQVQPTGRERAPHPICEKLNRCLDTLWMKRRASAPAKRSVSCKALWLPITCGYQPVVSSKRVGALQLPGSEISSARLMWLYQS